MVINLENERQPTDSVVISDKIHRIRNIEIRVFDLRNYFFSSKASSNELDLNSNLVKK